ncbi:hypothetical protein [Pseudolactococcus hodotermopsidis]|uniref:hypothetical protein n=1 Tax=Pseudolactococcus hodotermopsidis TaxID=2709157 RepID=UPI001551D52D|nr:hypothetical protein [Lactococcus hodotermopsidis]
MRLLKMFFIFNELSIIDEEGSILSPFFPSSYALRDSQSVKTTFEGNARGIDGGKSQGAQMMRDWLF